MSGQLLRIFLKRAKGGRMDSVTSAALEAGRGIVGNADVGGRRQVTLLSQERWEALMHQVRASLGSEARRANLVLSGIDLENTRNRVLVVGTCRLRILGETRPCEQMERAAPGLQAAMRKHWGGGAFAEVLNGGNISVGDRVDWDSESE